MRAPTLIKKRVLAGIDIDIVPGLSFADLAWNRLGIDPMTSPEFLSLYQEWTERGRPAYRKR